MEPLPKRAGDGFVEEELFFLAILKKKRGGKQEHMYGGLTFH